MPELGVAIYGSSGHAARVSAPVIASTPGARLVGVLGSTLERGERLARKHDGARAYASFDELAADDDVAAVWVAGPNDRHVEFAARCLEAGKHVLVEKPLATRLADAVELEQVADASGRVVRVAFQHRFRPAHAWIRSAIADGRVGQLRMLRIHRFWPYPYYPDMPAVPEGWRTSLESSGGWVLNDMGAHLVDLAMWLAGDHALLAAAHTANLKFADVDGEDTALLVLETPAGAVLLIEMSNAMASFPGTIEVHGLDGWIRADGTFDGGGRIVTSTGDEQAFPPIANEDAYRGEFADFVGAVNGEPSQGATAGDAVANVAIVEAAATQHRAREVRV